MEEAKEVRLTLVEREAQLGVALCFLRLHHQDGESLAAGARRAPTAVDVVLRETPLSLKALLEVSG